MYRIVKERWYHRVWDWFFKPGEPAGFQIGWLACRLYLNGETGRVIRVDHETEKTIEISENHLRSNPVKRKEMHKQKRTISTVMPTTLEYDPGRFASRSMGRLSRRTRW